MKGLMKSLEAVVSVLGIMAVYALLFTGQQNLPDFETANWKLKGMEALVNLDKAGQLKYYALSGDNSTIDTKVSAFLPASVEHEIQICGRLDCPFINKDVSKLASIDYLIAGDAANSLNRRIILYMWTVD